MLHLLARSAPRLCARSAARGSRAAAATATTASRGLSPTSLSSSSPPFDPAGARRTLTAAAATPGTGSPLGDVLVSEIEVEEENAGVDEPDSERFASLEAKVRAAWHVTDERGRAVVTLVHKTNGARVEFDCRVESDPNAEDDDDEDDDDAPPRVDDDDDDDDDGERKVVLFEVHVAGKGAGSGKVVFECVATGHEEPTIEKVSHYGGGDGKEAVDDATGRSADEDDEQHYSGPDFDELDPALQMEFDAFLEKLGVDGDLAGFVCLYADRKEHAEYVHWLRAIQRALV